MITHFLTDDDLVFTVYFGLVQCLIGTLESAPENVTVTHQGNSDANLNPAGSTTSIQVELFDARANTFADIDRTVDISLCQATDKFISSEDNDNGWDIRLNFEFEGLGPISCHLFLEGRALAASFYSDQDQTRNRIDQALPELKHQLLNAGFTYFEFHSFPGSPAKTLLPERTSYS